ncbi:MAG: sugar ABC transporter ATP-binding protein [Spirochaetales bacterium]|nr:sugar ABC transporter ATP-binding protein [Spirochaetales bacterium]
MVKEKELLRVEDLHKSFPGVKALKGINFQVLSGEVHALVGENGAGKSTFIKCVMGVYKKDARSGGIFVENKEVDIHNPDQAMKLGLGAVYQDVMMARHLTVAENFFLGKLPHKAGIIDWRSAKKNTDKVLKELEIDVDSSSILGDLSIAKQEMVAIAKMYSNNCKVAIFDEPTALLSTEETDILFSLIRRLRDKGMGIIYISHRLEEIFELTDRITVFKDGTYVDTVRTEEVDEDRIIELMVGRSVEDMYGLNKPSRGETVLEVRNLSKKDVFEDISFDVRKGEIFGMFGLVGSGRSDIVSSIFGAEKPDSGTVLLNGSEINCKHPGDGISRGIGFLTEDRKHTGLFMELSCRDNTNALSYRKMSRFGVISRKKEAQNADAFRDKLRIKTPSMGQLTKNLSGGNQQKVVLSKWLSNDSDLLIIDEPTVGVDVGAKVEIYKLLESLLHQGKSILMISSYLPEVMGLADRILVVSEGRQMGIVEKNAYSLGNFDDEQKFIKLASGIV